MELTLQHFFTTNTTPSYCLLIGQGDENTKVGSDWSVLTQSRHITRLSCILMGSNDLVKRLKERGGNASLMILMLNMVITSVICFPSASG